MFMDRNGELTHGPQHRRVDSLHEVHALMAKRTHLVPALTGAALLIAIAAPAMAGGDVTTGPSSSESPYIVRSSSIACSPSFSKTSSTVLSPVAPSQDVDRELRAHLARQLDPQGLLVTNDDRGRPAHR